MRIRVFLIMAINLLIFAMASAWADEFIVLGDMRPGKGNQHFKLAKLIIEDAITYVVNETGSPQSLAGILLTGDYVLNGGNAKEWEEFRKAYEPAFSYPIYPCLGNHELDFLNLAYNNTHYYKTFGVPRWYAINIKNVHLVAIDSNLMRWSPFSPAHWVLEWMQYEWFTSDLRQNDQKFTIVLWHEPAYGSHGPSGRGHGSQYMMRDRYVPVCEENEVDLIICGHNHWYERTFPIKNGTRDPRGIIHLTTGGGGVDLTRASKDPKDKVRDLHGKIVSAVNESTYHFCVLSIEDDTISLVAIEYKTHKVLDSLTIYSSN